MANCRMEEGVQMGPVHLTVVDLTRSLVFYKNALGFQLLDRDDDTARLGAADGRPVVVLHGDPAARPRPARSAGLYHYAVLLPTRAELARALQRLAAARYPLQGASDHGVSEALYLADLDGNGIELYADRPRDQWPRRGGELEMVTGPLDLDDLLRTLAPGEAAHEGLPAGTRIGHVHLHVGDLDRAEAFYGDVLGFDRIQRLEQGAAFLSAGGYHHHLGLNTWAGKGVPPAPAGAVGLRHLTVVLPNHQALDRAAACLQAAGIEFEARDGTLETRDPAGNGVVLVVGAGA